MRRWILLIAALLLFVLAFLVVRAGTRGRPLGEERDGPLAVERYDTVDLRPLEIVAAVAKGESVPLVLGGERWLLQLHARNLVAPGCTAITLTDPPTTAPCPTDLGTYAGGVSNTSDWSQARLSITAEGVRGTVRFADVTWMLEPLQPAAGAPPAGTVRHAVYRTSDISGRLWFEGERGAKDAPPREEPAHSGWGAPQPLSGDDPRPGCDPEDRPCAPPKGGTDTPPPPPPIRTLGVAMAADRQYVDGARFSPSVLARQAATLNMVDGMYRREGIATFRIASVITDPGDLFFSSSNSSALLNAIVPAYAAAGVDITSSATRVARGISTAFLTSGKPPDGIILGLANQPGITGMAFQDLSLSLDGATAAAKETTNWMVMAHELGHNYNGQHEQADWFCRFFFFFCWNSARTLMWPSYSFRTSPEFSRGFWDRTHNNRQTIQGHLATRTP